jgi:hypothetical protein
MNKILISFLILTLIPLALAIEGNGTDTTVRYAVGYITFNSTEGSTNIQSFGDHLSSLIKEADLLGRLSRLNYNVFKPSTPELNFPENNTYRNTSANIFIWSNSTDDDELALSYIFEAWNNSLATNLNRVNYSIKETENTTQSKETIKGEGTFYWRVAANDSDFNSSFTNLRAIILDQTLPSLFNLTSPADLETTTDTTPRLVWEESTDSNLDNYTIEISTLQDFSTLTTTEVIEEEDLTNWSTSLDKGTYYWRVNAVDKANNQRRSSNNLSFIIKASEITTPAGGGGSKTGGGSKAFTLNILAPEGVTLTPNDEIEVPLLVINPSKIKLRGISLAVSSDEPKIVPTLDITSISELEPQAQERIKLTLNTQDVDIGSYGIIIDASIIAPSFTDQSRIFANLLEKTAGEQEVQEQIELAKQLFNGNPECLDLSEYIAQAESALQKQNADTALSLAENAIVACNKLLAQKSEFASITAAATFIGKAKTQLQNKTVQIVASEVMGLLLLLFIIYRYRKSKKKI